MNDAPAPALLNRALKRQNQIFRFFFIFNLAITHDTKGRIVPRLHAFGKNLADMMHDDFFNQHETFPIAGFRFC